MKGQMIMLASRLNYGDTIGLVSPSHIATPEQYAPIIRVLKQLGFKIKTGKNLYKSTYGYSATEMERADDLNDMFSDEEVKMVFFGGGEAGNELLPYINFENIASHPKLVCSYSDGTTILDAIYAKTGLITYYGQAPGDFSDLRYYDYTQFISHFVDGSVQTFQSNSKWETLHNGVCKGILIGGYTRNFALLTGSSHFHYDNDQKYLLFLEDHEKFSGIDAVSAYISHIEQCDLIDQVTGLLFGHYSTTFYPELFQRLERFGTKHNVPVVYCDDFGHGVNHAILPIGCMAEMDADQQTLNFLP